MKVLALCNTCRHRHSIDFDPRMGPGAAFSDWMVKHPGPIHDVDFLWPQRTGKAMQSDDYWLHYLHNADVRPAYGASVAVTITLQSLAASSTLLAGRESTLVSNVGATKYGDYHLAGHYRTAATNLQAGRIRTAVVGARDDTPNWPDVFDGTDSVETVTVQAIYDSICKVASDIVTDATQRTWPFGPVSVAALFGQSLPTRFVTFVSHSAHTATNAWSATEADHSQVLTPIYATVA